MADIGSQIYLYNSVIALISVSYREIYIMKLLCTGRTIWHRSLQSEFNSWPDILKYHWMVNNKKILFDGIYILWYGHQIETS